MPLLRASILLLLSLTSVCAIFGGNTSLVVTKYGILRGFKYETDKNTKSDIFLNIPYASPPLGNLRFEKPVPPKPWLLRDATKWGLACAASSLGVADISTNSEDCLSMNIFRPSGLLNRPHDGYPVLVWIHGGGNVIADAKMFGYRNLSNNFNPQGVIVVSVQYRLGPFGFASTGDNVMPGNLGLWDMIQAAKFLRENIADFGGNPNRIVLWGLSSSAIDLSSLAFTPHAYNHFDGIILQSGTSYSAYGANNVVIKSTRNLAAQLGCSLSSSAAIKSCLKSKSLQEFWDALNVTGMTQLDPQSILVEMYLGRIDGDLFAKNISELMKVAPPKPAIIGGGDQEAALYSVFGNLFSPYTPFILRPSDWTIFGEANFTRLVRQAVVDEAFYGPLAPQAADEIIAFYTADKPASPTNFYWIQKYTQLIGDLIFTIPSLFEVKERAQRNWPTYLYENTYYSQALFDTISTNDPVYGSFHTNEYVYQFGVYSLGIEYPFTAADKSFQKALVETIANFVKTGNPSTPYLNWQPVSASHPFRYAKIDDTPTFETGPHPASARRQFWDDLGNSGRYPFNVLYRVNYNNITSYACNIATNNPCW